MENRRVHPRINLDLNLKVGVRHTNEAQFFDISQGGASFLSTVGYDTGWEITLEFGTLTIQVKVVDSSLIKPQEGLNKEQYKVRCQFMTVDGLAAHAFFEMITNATH